MLFRLIFLALAVGSGAPETIPYPDTFATEQACETRGEQIRRSPMVHLVDGGGVRVSWRILAFRCDEELRA